MVYLIGAGPGDPGLLTLAGAQALAKADVVVYDALANDLLLLHAPQAKRIFVGKRAGAHSWVQSNINQLLVKLASQGKIVARLKGGDPYVFGRGGEEALALKAKGLAFEVIPGVTSGIAALAYAGIPLTHRGLATSSVFVTGQERTGQPLKPSTLKALAQLDATLVFYMATQQALRVTQALIKAGKPASTPAALVHKGSLPGQKVLIATLGTLATEMQATGLGSPGLIVVGPVVGLRKQLAWFDKKPLFGRRIVVTRAQSQASKLSQGLRDLGADVFEAPALKTQRLKLNSSRRAALSKLSSFRWLILSSVNGVACLFEDLADMGLDARALAGVKIAAIGAATAEALESCGLRPDLMPKQFNAEGLRDALIQADRKLKGAKVLLARAKVGRDVLPQALKAVGAKVVDLALYQTLPDKSQARELSQRVLAGHLEAVTFASASAAEQFDAQLSPPARKKAKAELAALCMGPVTRAKALALGYRVESVAEEASISAFIQSIQAWAQSR